MRTIWMRIISVYFAITLVMTSPCAAASVCSDTTNLSTLTAYQNDQRSLALLMNEISNEQRLDIKPSPPLVMGNDEFSAEFYVQLDAQPRRPNAVHVGFGNIRNLDIILHRRSQQALIFDISTNMLNVWDLLRESFAETRLKNEDRTYCVTTFIEKVKERDVRGDKERARFYKKFETPYQVKLKKALQDARTWCGTDENFNFIASLFAEGRIQWAQADILEVKNMQKARAWVEDRGYVVDSLYISNIYEWVRGDFDDDGRYDVPDPALNDRLFARSITALASAETVMIESGRDGARYVIAPVRPFSQSSFFNRFSCPEEVCDAIVLASA